MGGLKYENKPLRTRWYSFNSLYTTCSFKYFGVGPFILEWVIGKTSIPAKAFAEKLQKHQGKEIQAKLLVTENNE